MGNRVENLDNEIQDGSQKSYLGREFQLKSEVVNKTYQSGNPYSEKKNNMASKQQVNGK